MTPVRFEAAFRDDLARLIRWRRDVRRFRPDPIPEAWLDRWLDLACLAPSVGNSQPWRFVRVDSAAARAAIRRNFEATNRAALQAQPAQRAASYARLRLEGLAVAPVQLAVFADVATAQGHGLGSATMPETLAYSVVTAIHTLWLVARADGVGVGWVSILDPVRVAADLDLPVAWRLVAYLCVGWPEDEHDEPELARFGWQERTTIGRTVIRR